MSIAEAKQEKYYYCSDGKTPKDTWATNRGAMKMLWARVVSDSVAAVCPEAHEFYTAEENQEFENINEERKPVIIDQTPPPVKAEKPKPEIVITTTAQAMAPEIKKEIEKPLEVVTEDKIDFTLIPVGDAKGQPFNVLSIEQLNKLRNNKKIKSILPEHIIEIEKAIAAKEAESAALIKADDARAESGTVSA
ncbi:MAG TPA: hypothetical protein VIJ25_12060 [Methylococcales bacterium]